MFTHTFRFTLIAVALTFFLPSAAHAETRIFAWDPPTTNADGTPLTDLGGYRISYGTSSGNYTNTIDAGRAPTVAVPNLNAGTQYFFAVRAYDLTGNLSAYSNQVSLTAQIDSDGDGLSDSSENNRGTNPNNPDTDGDGVVDGQEVADGSNPLDKGSHNPFLSTRICGEWNGFLGGMANVFEHLNLGSTGLNVTTQLLSITGAAAGNFQFALAAGAQFDALIHDMSGRTLNSYGLVCSTHDGAAGQLNGRMVYYKGNSPGARKTGQFQFAFAMEMSPGKKGSQFVPFNTYQPSLSFADAENAVANWIQLTNLGQVAVSGTLFYYDQVGTVLASQDVTLNAGARGDFSGHRFGKNLVGMVEWRPQNTNVAFLMRNVRYVFDNPEMRDNFDTAFQLEGMYGSGDNLYVPLDTISRTAVLELMNTLNEPIHVDVTIAGGSGASFGVDLPAHGSYHYVADSVLGPNAAGFALIKSPTRNGVAAVAMQYTRRADASVSSMYGLPAKPLLGSLLRGSYNTFLEQSSWLILVSPNAQNVSVSTVNGAGQQGPVRTVAVNGFQAVNLNEFANTNEYGVVTVVPTVPNSLVGWVLRVRGSDYVIPTAVR